MRITDERRRLKETATAPKNDPPAMSDLTDCWKSKQEGFADAANIIGKLLIAWEENEADLARLRHRCESLEKAIDLAIGFAVAFRQDHGADALRFPEVGVLFSKMTAIRAEQPRPMKSPFSRVMRGDGNESEQAESVVAPAAATEAGTPAARTVAMALPNDDAESPHLEVGPIEVEAARISATVFEWGRIRNEVHKRLAFATAPKPPGPPTLPQHENQRRGRVECLRELLAWLELTGADGPKPSP